MGDGGLQISHIARMGQDVMAQNAASTFRVTALGFASAPASARASSVWFVDNPFGAFMSVQLPLRAYDMHCQDKK